MATVNKVYIGSYKPSDLLVPDSAFAVFKFSYLKKKIQRFQTKFLMFSFKLDFFSKFIVKKFLPIQSKGFSFKLFTF